MISVQQISEFRGKQDEKRKEQEKRDRQRLEQLQKFLQEQAAYDLQRYDTIRHDDDDLMCA